MLGKKEKLILIIIGALICYSTVDDPDFGWHLEYGEWLFKTGTILRDNIFSYTMPDYKWANSYWLAELIIYLIFTYLGPVALSLLLSLALSTLSVTLVNKVSSNNFAKVIFLTLLWLGFSATKVSVRPFFFSTVFIFLLTYVLLYKRSYIKFLPLMFLVWVNAHADFILGLFILATFALLEVISAVKAGKYRTAVPVVIALFLSLIATLFNPFGIKLWETIIMEIFNQTQFNTVAEWKGFFSATKNDSFDPVSAITNAIILLIATLPCIKYRAKYGLWYALVNIVFLILTIKSVYFFRILYVVGIFGMIWFWNNFAEKTDIIFKLSRERVFKYVPNFTITFISFVALLAGTEKIYSSVKPSRWEDRSFCSQETLNFIREIKPEGNMYNNFGLGGYLVWKLPEYKTFIDGRMNSWKDSDGHLFDDYVTIIKNPDENYRLFMLYIDRFDIGWALLLKEEPLAKVLEKNVDTWELVKQHEKCSVFIRNTKNNKIVYNTVI